MQTKRPPAALRVQPPLIPVIDVVFNLLIFFMLTPSVSTGEGYLTTNLPSTSGPVAGKATIPEIRIKVELYDVGPNGKFIDNAKNEYCSITVAGQDLGGNFDALQKVLEDMRDRGLSPNTPVLISPTMGTLHQWVVRAFDAAVASRFTNVQFAVPYE